MLTNAHITSGKTVKKRPGLQHVATLETGTRGLKASGDKLQTFYESGSISHANTLFQANKVPHPTASQQVKRVWAHDVVLGYQYVAIEFIDGSLFHFYLDDPGAWQAATAYPVGTFRRPTVANGFRYEATAIAGTGTSGGAEPVWPTTVGATVVDNAGANQITWTCRSTYVADASCPHGKSFIKLASKVWSTKKAFPLDTVPYCKTNDPRDWSEAGDAGFLPVSMQQKGAADAYAVGEFQKQLVVYFDTSCQVWDVSSNPANNAINQKIPGVGTVHPLTPVAFASDNFFLANAGIRSVTVSAQTENKQDNDVGSPIDALVTAAVGSTVPISLYVTSKAQYWLAMGNIIWVYSYSRSAKLAAWSKYVLPFAIDDLCESGSTVYVRTGDDVYQFSDAQYTDNGTTIQVEVELPFLDFKLPGVLKQLQGVDAVIEGSAYLYLKYNPAREADMTPLIEISGDTRPEVMRPVELLATSVAPRIVHAANEPFELHAIQFFYNPLGPM